ncbi:MAG TPA: hypothetical protein ENK97_04370 [Campylobacteraceae bacterium]|nr:hypothetical protein [Campylobacteraceae bacterium]
MQRITEEEFQKLVSIIPPYPGVAIFHMSDEGVQLPQMLDAYAREKGYIYHPVSADEGYIARLHEAGIGKARKITYKQQRFNQHARQYDYIYIEIDPFGLDNPQLFLKKIYAISKKAAKILFFVPKVRDGLEALEALLEKANFVAINPIDDMFEEAYVLSAQKMHGWGIYDM